MRRRSLAAKTWHSSRFFANLDRGSGLGKLRPYAHWCFVPDGEHGSGTGDHWHGGKRRRWDGSLTPLRRYSKPFVTGPNPTLNCLFRRKGCGQRRRCGKTGGRRKNGPGDCNRRTRVWCRQQCPLSGGTSRPGSGTSAPIRVFYCGPLPAIGSVEKLRREHRIPAIDRRVLDSSIRHSGRTGS